MFKYFFKDKLHINKSEYVKEITKLIEENFLLTTELDKIYILNPVLVEYINSVEFNIF